MFSLKVLRYLMLGRWVFYGEKLSHIYSVFVNFLPRTEWKTVEKKQSLFCFVIIHPTPLFYLRIDWLLTKYTKDDDELFCSPFLLLFREKNINFYIYDVHGINRCKVLNRHGTMGRKIVIYLDLPVFYTTFYDKDTKK